MAILALAWGARAETTIETGTVHCAYQQTVTYDYVVKLPDGYNSSTQSWPLLLQLHGSSGMPIGPSLDTLRAGAQKFSHPMLFVQPQWQQGPRDEPREHYWNPKAIAQLIRDLSDKYRVDRGRVYLTGGSMGGGATWEIAGRYPHLFAAIAPVAGWPDVRTIRNLRFVPLWAFHGGKDSTVDPALTQFGVELLNKYGGDAKMTLFPEVGHDSSELAWNNPQLFTWFLTHTRQCRASDEFVTKAGTCTLISLPPMMDGNLGDRVWKTAETLTGFMDPCGPEVAVQTQIRLLADSTNLYVGVLAHEPNMAGILCQQTNHDSNVWSDDSVEIFLNPSNDHKTYYQIVINASGAVFDAKGRDKAWDASGLRVKTGRRADAWTVEAAIPWDALDHARPPQCGQGMRVLFGRNRPQPNFPVVSQWPPTNGGNHAPEHFARITFRAPAP